MKKLIRNISLFVVMLCGKVAHLSAADLFPSSGTGGTEHSNVLNDTLNCISDSITAAIHFTRIDSMIDYAKTFIGTPYKFGSESVSTFDCSGFISYVYQKFGLELPHCSVCMSQMGETVKLDDVQKGDLLFFKGRNVANNGVHHVAMVVDVDGDSIKIIQATHRGVVVDDLNQMTYYKSRFLTAKRVGF